MDHSLMDRPGTAPSGQSSELVVNPADRASCKLSMAPIAIVRHVTLDELSNVRYLHAQAVKLLVSGQMSEDEQEAGRQHIYSQKYVDALGAAVRRNQFYGIWLSETLAGTAGWSAIDDSASIARIRSIFVSPLYARLGLAGRLLTHAEGAAVEAGYRTFSVRSIQSSVGFFVRHGYAVTSHGSRGLPPDKSVPVTFLRKSI